MPKYKVFQESTGVSLYLEGDEEPGLEDIKRAFAFYGQQKYPNAPVLQEPTSLYERAKSVAPSLARLAAPLVFGGPTPQDVGTAGRVLQQASEAPGVLIDKALGRDTYRKPEEMLDAASRIEREGIMALGSASTEKRERAARIGRSLGETISEYTPIPEYVTRPAGEVLGQVSADLLSPMNVMGLGIAGAARQAARIPSLVAGAEFAESTTPAAVRAAQIADLTRASEAARTVDQAAKTIPRLLVPEITRGSAESAGIALQTISDPNATPEEKLKASYEALIGTLFAAGLGAEVARSLNVPGKNVTQVDILNNLASQKKTVGEAIGQVSGLLDQMERIVPVENLKTQFRKYVNELNPDEPFVYSKEPVGEGPRSRSRFVPDEERVALEKENAFVEQQKKSQEAAQQAALERSAAASGTPLKTVAEIFEDRNRPPVMERRPSVNPEEASAVRRGTVTPEAVDLLASIDAGGVPSIITRNLERVLNENGITVTDSDTPNTAINRLRQKLNQPPVIKAEAAMPTEGTPLRSVEDLLAERLRTRDERIAVEAESARPETLTTAEGVQAQRASERQALRERSAAIRKVLGRREFTAEELMRGEPTPEVPAEPVRSGEIITPELTVERPAPREGGMLPAREPEGTPLRSVDDILAERLKARDERLATEGKFRQKAEGVAQKLEGLRTEVEAGLGANPFPQLMGAAWNGALSVAQAVIRAGGSVADGVAAGIRYARQNFKGKFDDAEFGSQLAQTIQRPFPIQVPPKMEARAFSERLAAAPGIPPQMREAIAQSPESSYLRQNQDVIKNEAAAKTKDQLIADIANPESNTKTVDSLELVNRMLAEGKIDEATALGTSLSKNLTTAGQIINQAKLLNSTTRPGFILLVDKTLQKFGKKLNSEQASKLGDAIDQYRNASNQLETAELNWKNAADNGDLAGIKKNKSSANLANAKKIEADVVLAQLLARINPASAGDLYLATVQGSVLSPKSIEGGALGNLMGYPFREISDIIAGGLDSLYGNENNSYNIRARTVTRLTEFFKSLPEAWKVIIKGSDAMPYEVGNVSGSPLNAQRAFGRLIEDLRNNALISKSTPRNVYEAVFGAVPDLFLRLTQAVDLPFRKAERAVAIEEMARRRGFSDSQVELAKRNPDLFLISEKQKQSGRKGFTEKDLGEIEFESLSRVFQQENAVTKGVSAVNSAIKNRFGNKAYVPYRILTSLFQKTPINVAAEILTYTPLGLLQYYDWASLSRGQKQKIASKVLLGSSVMYASNYLYDKGVVTSNLDTPGETNKARELAKSGGVMPPGSLNVSGLRRLVKGGDPAFKSGDTVKDLSRMGTLGALMMIQGTSKRLNELARTDDPEYFSQIKGSAISGINFINQQQFMKGAADTIKVLSEESGQSLDRWLRSFAVTAATPFAPNILAASRRAQREYQPSIGHEGFAKDAVNELNQRYSALGLAIPGVKDPNAMPVRRDLWGEAVAQTPKSENPWVYNLFSPWNSREIEADPLNASIYTLWRRTADNSAIPSVPNPKLTYEKQTFDRMSPEQYDRYTQLVGFYRRQASEYVFTHGAYQQGSDEVKLEILKDAYNRGFKIGKYRFIQELRESGETLTPVAARRGFQQPSE